MKPFETKTTRFIGSGFFALLLVLTAMAVLWSGSAMTVAGNNTAGLISGFFPPVAKGVSSAAAITTAGIFVASGIMMLTNRTFSILRTSSKLHAGLFAFMTCATPGAAGLQLSGIIMCVCVLLCLMTMYTTYYRAAPNRRIFLVFAILTTGSLYHYSFAAFIPVALINCAQVRRLTVRSFFAAIIGIVTPLWILWGFSVADPSGFVAPDVSLPTASIIRLYSPAQLLAIGGTLAAALLTTTFNMIKVYGYNARIRAFNGVLAAITLWAAVITIVDLGHAMTYMPLLCALTAMQTTLHFRIAAQRRSYISIILITLLFVCVLVWNLDIRISL